MTDWTNYTPEIKLRSEHFVIVNTPDTKEGYDTLMQMERMRHLGYRFVVEGFSGLVFEITRTEITDDAAIARAVQAERDACAQACVDIIETAADPCYATYCLEAIEARNETT